MNNEIIIFNNKRLLLKFKEKQAIIKIPTRLQTCKTVNSLQNHMSLVTICRLSVLMALLIAKVFHKGPTLNDYTSEMNHD